MGAGAAVGDEQWVDLRGTRMENIFVAAVIGTVAGALVVAAVFSAVESDAPVAILCVVIAAGLGWLATVNLRARLRAGPEGIRCRVGGRVTTTPWAEVQSIYRVWNRGRIEGLVALSPGGRLVSLGCVDYAAFRPFDDDELTRAVATLARLAASHGQADLGSASDPHADWPPDPDITATVRRPDAVYRRPGWGRSWPGVAFPSIWFGAWLGAAWFWEHSVLALVAVGWPAWLVARNWSATPRPGQVELEADDVGVRWYGRRGDALDWSDIVAIVPTDERRPRVLLLDEDHRAHALPRPAGVEPERLAAELAARRPASGFSGR